MKVGIITFHRALNYGAVLQCYAMQQILLNYFDKVDIIDYKQSAIDTFYRTIRFDKLLKSLISFKSFFNFVVITWYNIKRRRPFLLFKRYLNITKPDFTSSMVLDNYDIVFVGSDQLLNIGITNGIDPVYSGSFTLSKVNAKKVAYAISLDKKSANLLTSKQIQEIIENFDFFSVREKWVSQFFQLKTNILVPICIDPTLLADESIWSNLIEAKRNAESYVVLYEVRTSYGENSLTSIAQNFATNNGLKCVNISNPFIDVKEWLSIIKHAKCVFTSSFHATVFSIIFRTPFYSFVMNDGNDDRYVELLFQLGIEDHIIDGTTDVYNIPTWPKNIDERLTDLRKESLRFVEQCFTINSKKR